MRVRLFSLLLAFGFLVLSAIPALASSASLQVKLFGLEYAVGSDTCGQTSSFAGLGTTTSGQLVAFNTTVCHTSLSGLNPAITAGGSFTLYAQSLTLVGSYAGGTITPGSPEPLFPGSTVLCKQDFQISAVLAPGTPSEDATSISSGTALGVLTHVGFFANGGCAPFAASITGSAMLNY